MIHAEALTHLRAGRPRDAVALLKTSLENQPADAQGWFLLGACHHALNEFAVAADAFSRSLALDPASAEAHLAHITVLRAAGKRAAAVAASRTATMRSPNNPRVLFAAALCLEEAGEREAALAHYDEALRVAPDLEDASYNKALLLSRIGRHADAAALLSRIRESNPNSDRTFGALADTQLALGDYNSVLGTLGRIAPQDAANRVRRGVALASLRRFAEARYELAAAQDHDAPGVLNYLQRVAAGSDPRCMLSPENIYLGRAWSRLAECDWTVWEGFVAEMHRAAQDPQVVIEPAVAFMCQHAPLSGSERHAIGRKIAAEMELQTATLPAPPRPSVNHIRVGILSADYREHLNAYEILPLLQLIDSTRFVLYAYSLAPDDGSSIRARVREAAHAFVDLDAMDDETAAAAIRRDDIDILVDVTGHKTGGRFGIVARRPARLQVSYSGYSNSLASKRLDYALVDRIIGDDDSEWTEARASLPVPYYLHDYREGVRSTKIAREEYGLPQEAIVYCAFHKAEKISPDAFDLWMQVLLAVPSSVLWLRAPPEVAQRRLRDEARQRGVDPARLVFAPFEPSHDPRYFARHRLGDLMLDSLHHNAIESACDAWGEGLPVLTLRGSALASRAGESLARGAGLPELVAKDKEDYVRTAIRLGTDRAALSALKQNLAANRHTAPLFDTAGRVRALEAAFQEMYDRMMRGEPPASFDVQP